MRGGLLPTLKGILGHGSMVMVLGYAHLAPGHSRGEMERIAKPGTGGTSRAQRGRISPGFLVNT